VPLALGCLAALRLGDRLPLDTTARLAAWLTLTIAVGALVFWLTSVALRSPERAALRGMLPLRRSR
jgi:hypothetical protein